MNDYHVLACHRIVLTLIAVVVVVFVSCYPERQATLVEGNHLDTVTVVRAPAKVFLSDASVVLFPEGFQLKGNLLEGLGWRFPSIGIVRNVPLENLARESLRIPRDSAVAMTYYEKIVTGGRGFASAVHVLTGAALMPASLYCLANPKACFGSCPTVYTRDDDSWEFEAELFSYSVSRLLEREDLDRIGRRGCSGSPFTLRVANEALETHHINLMKLVGVRHPTGTTVFPVADGSIVAVKDLCEPVSALNSEGMDVLQSVQYWDDCAYRSESTMVRQVRSGRTSDWIDLRFRPPRRGSTATVVMRLKNTLLSTVLFYEIVLGSQGVQAIEWTQRMNSDRVYAALFRSIYSQFSGVKVMTRHDGTWKIVGDVPDAGPVGWKPAAVRVPVEVEDELVMRLEFFPDNILVDYVAMDFGSEERQVSIREISPVAVQDKTGALRPDILPLVQEDDGRYLVTEPRDVYRFRYELPVVGDGEMTFFVRSKGFYTEWLRGDWIAARAGSSGFDLSHIDQTMVNLAELWIQERGNMESLFFRNRIPVTEDL